MKYLFDFASDFANDPFHPPAGRLDRTRLWIAGFFVAVLHPVEVRRLYRDDPFRALLAALDAEAANYESRRG